MSCQGVINDLQIHRITHRIPWDSEEGEIIDNAAGLLTDTCPNLGTPDERGYSHATGIYTY